MVGVRLMAPAIPLLSMPIMFRQDGIQTTGTVIGPTTLAQETPAEPRAILPAADLQVEARTIHLLRAPILLVEWEGRHG